MQPGVPDDTDAVAGAVLGYRDWFAELEPRTGPQAELKTILILFPDLPAAAMPELIDRTQSALKPAFVPNGLMIGEFHPTPPEQPGLWNPDFRPLRSPVPLLAIRQMVPSDLPFLADDRDYLTAYLRQFGDQVPARCRPQLEAALARFGLADSGRGLPAEVTSALARESVDHIVHCHAALPGPVRTPHDLAAALGVDVGRVTKTLLVESSDGTLLRIVASVTERVDLLRLAALLGVRRLRLASAATLERVLGQPPGGVSPLGSATVGVVVEVGLLSHETIMVGAGVAGVDIELSPNDLLRLCTGRVLSFGIAYQTANSLPHTA